MPSLVLPKWITSPAMVSYIVESYAGVEMSRGLAPRLRHVFLWQDDNNILMGNTEAFAEHIRHHFGQSVANGFYC